MLLQLGLVGYDQWQVSQSGGTLSVAGNPVIPESTIPFYSVHAIGVQANFILPGEGSSALLQVLMSTGLWPGRKGEPSSSAFPGRCAFRRRSRRSRKGESAKEPNGRMFAFAFVYSRTYSLKSV